MRRLLVIGLWLLALILLLLIINYRRIVDTFSSAENGLFSLRAGIEHLVTQPKTAQRDFARADTFFAGSSTNLKKIDPVTKTVFSLPVARNKLALLKAGHTAADSGQILAKLLEDPPPAAAGDLAQTIGAATSWLNHWQSTNQDNLSQLLLNLKSLASLNEQTHQLPESISSLAQKGESLLAILRQSPDLFGSRGDRRYMIIFQNNTELRPTGGFIGSYATLTFKQDGGASFNFGPNIYHAITNQTTWQKLPVPYPILDDQQYGLRVYEANWNPDFPTSAQLLQKFYESIHGVPAQGVIAVDTSLITDLLDITGPLDFPQYNTTLTADNFLETVQYKVEKEYFEDATNVAENNPKKILSDLLPVLFQKIGQLDWSGKQRIYQLLGDAVSRRSIQIYSSNSAVETELVKLGIAGEMKQSSSDYLHINNANVGGFKSSLNVTQQVDLTQRVVGNRIQNTLTITRTHNGDGQWPDADNRNFMRLYLPLGSQIVSTTGAFEQYSVAEENGHTCLAGWFTTPVANKKKAVIVYLLPESIDKRSYSLTWQRQGGDLPTNYTVDSPLLGRFTGELTTDQVLTRR